MPVKTSKAVSRDEFDRLRARVERLARETAEELRRIEENTRARDVQFTRIAQMQVELDRLKTILSKFTQV